LAGELDRAGISHWAPVADRRRDSPLLREPVAKRGHEVGGRPAGVQKSELDGRAPQEAHYAVRRDALARAVLFLEPETVHLPVAKEVEHPGLAPPPLQLRSRQLLLKLCIRRREHAAHADRDR